MNRGRHTRFSPGAGLLALTAVVLGLVGCNRKDAPSRPTVARYPDVLIRGTAMMDVDTGTVSPKDKKTRDFHWQQRSQTARCIEPRNGAAVAHLGDVDFEKLALSDLERAVYSEKPIKGDDDNNQLTPGTVVAVRTNLGNYAKMLVTENIPMESTSRGERRLYKFYSMKATFVVYGRE
jgi:hypothetical protein